MPSADDQLPQLFSRNITRFGLKLSNTATVDPNINGNNVVLSSMQIHSIITLLLFGAKGRSAVELMALVFPEWCSYDSIIHNYRTLLTALGNTSGDVIRTRKVITFNLNKNLNLEFIKVATEYFYTELIVMRHPTSFIVPVPNVPFPVIAVRQPPYLPPSYAPPPQRGASHSEPFPARSYSIVHSAGSVIYQFNHHASSLNVPNHAKVITISSLNYNYNPGSFLSAYIESIITCKLPSHIKRNIKMEYRMYYETATKEYMLKMMIFNGRFKYGTITSVGEVIELPLENSDFSLLMFKPFYRWGLLSLQKAVNFECFRDLKVNMKYKDNIHVEMPIFNVRTNIVLNSSLHQTGLSSIFTNGLDLGNAFDNSIPAGYNGSLPMPPIVHGIISNFLVTQKINFGIDTTDIPLNNENHQNNPNSDTTNNANTTNQQQQQHHQTQQQQQQSTENIPNNGDNTQSNNNGDNNSEMNNLDEHNFNIDRPFLFAVRWNVYNAPLVIGTISTPLL